MRRIKTRVTALLTNKNMCKGGGASNKTGGGGGKKTTTKKAKTKSPNGSVKERRAAAKAKGIKGTAKLNSQQLADLGF